MLIEKPMMMGISLASDRIEVDNLTRRALDQASLPEIAPRVFSRIKKLDGRLDGRLVGCGISKGASQFRTGTNSERISFLNLKLY
jgi:hypothetical protein